MEFILKYFDELTPAELYDALQLREEVFQLEQDCLYKDVDGKDPLCYHLLLYNDHQLAAYARLVPEGVSYTGFCSVGRVVSSPALRTKGLGKKIMEASLYSLETLWPGVPVKISAQAYLRKFYENLGFLVNSEPYLEDNIPHIEMIKTAENPDNDH